MSKTILKMKDITKDFPGVRSLDNVSFSAVSGEVLALVGENGAGKSTLMKILSGAWPHNSFSGEILIKDTLHSFTSTKDAEQAGVAIIYQELNLIPELSIAENIFLDREFTTIAGKINWNKVYSETKILLKELHLDYLDPEEKVKELSIGKQQMVEIAKALSLNAHILVLDEPTSALTETETEDLFKIIKKLKTHNVCMIYISHKIDEIKKIADKIMVLRDGKLIGKTVKASSITTNKIISKMVGRDIKEMFPRHKIKRGGKTLEVKNLSIDHPVLKGKKRVKNVSFKAYKGEILGIAGLMGSGRSELACGIFGALDGDTTGKVFLNGEKVKIDSPQSAIENGIALLTEDRKTLGLIMGQSIIHNTTISSLETVSGRWIIDKLKENDIASTLIKKLKIKTSRLDDPIDSLSGGNQQKVVIGKWLNTNPDIFIMDEPTRGIDVGAKVEIYKLMHTLLKDGVTVIMISSDLQEIMEISDRILVMHEGRIVADLSKKQATAKKIMHYATGMEKTK